MLRIGDHFYADGAFKKAFIQRGDKCFLVKLFGSVKEQRYPDVIIQVNSDNEEDAIDILYNAIGEGVIKYDEDMYQVL